MLERWDTIDADHMDMVKFSDRNDDGYGKLLFVIGRLLKRPLGVELAPGHGREESSECVVRSDLF